MKASGITDEAFMNAMDEAMRIRTEVEGGTPWTWATRWDIAAVLAGHPEHVGCKPVDYAEVPERVLLAKAKRLCAAAAAEAISQGRRQYERAGRQNSGGDRRG